MLIRPATPDDSPAAVDVVKSVFDEYGFTWDEHDYHADLYDLNAAYLEPGHFFWVAENESGEVIGTAALEIFAALPGTLGETTVLNGAVRLSGCDCGLNRLYVKPDGRRSGAGSALLKTVIEKAKEQRRSRMEIWSDKRFTNAHRLYERFGATVAADRICADPDVSPEWGLILRLT